MTCELGALMDNLHCHETGLECPQNNIRCKHWLEMENASLRTRPKNLYASLERTLADALDQAANGKGKERHAADNAFEDQVICAVQRLLMGHPFGYQAGQAIKKTVEAGRLFNIGKPDAAKAEALGAINYLAAMDIMVDEMRTDK